MAKEYIERGDAFDAVMGQFCACSDETEAALNGAVDDIRKIPAADVAPVVRCKDCKHWIAGHISDNDTFYPPKCALVYDERSNDDFCSYGERREVQDDN